MNLTKEQREAIEWAAEQASRTCLLDYRKSLRSLLDAPSADDAPNGWKLVPVEPTQAMSEAALNTFIRTSDHETEINVDTIYAAMLAAAPTPEDAPSTTQGVALSAAARDVLAERHRQVSVEGWTPEHDDEHDSGDLREAAICYIQGFPTWNIKEGIQRWPWAESWWKPTTLRRNLVKATAMLIAEVERIDRTLPK